jgi:D-xylose 1-dehydrogenase (NADP+, D-xylono-1,5-lactone-forming)
LQKEVIRLKKLRWGVLGTGRIVQKTGPAIQRSSNGIWLGVAGRNAENSNRAAEAFEVERAYGSYQELIDDPEIDAVYIALLNHLHMEWAVKAANAGKHILLEKPFALNLGQAEAMIEAANKNGVHLMEAHAWRYHPGHSEVKKLVEQGAIGELSMMHAHFSFAADATSTRLVKEWGGGSLYDVGCYPIAWSRYFMDGEPLSAEGEFWFDPRSGVDMRFSGMLAFAGGRYSQISSALDMKLGSFYSLMGTGGRIDVRFEVTPDALKIHAHGPGVQDHQVWTTDRIEFYTRQAEAFAHCVLTGGALPYGVDDAYHNQKVIDELFASAARRGG